MEGSSTRAFPRTLLDKPIELQIGGDTIRVHHPANNVSVGGLFVRHAGLPKGASVRVRIVGRLVFEAHGRIRDSRPHEEGTGISFTPLTERNLEALYDLIEDLTLRGLPSM
ncbi:MAG: PilZ domain-containing protein [Acidobacteriia bacterium]|nr:PilZ domain-containing protein [Terriglobia bacterium]